MPGGRVRIGSWSGMKGCRFVAIAGVAIAASAGTAGAEANPFERENPCDVLEAPFPLTDSNRLDNRRLAERFEGKTFVVQRRLLQNLPPPKMRSFERVMRFYFRADGSMRTTCQHRRMPGSDLRPCDGFGPSESRSAENATDIAIWRINRGR